MGCCESKTNSKIFVCSGASDVGQLADRTGRLINEYGVAKLGCLAGIAAGFEGHINGAKNADKIIAIDGCSTCCAKQILADKGFDSVSINLADYGYKKNETPVDDAVVIEVAKKIIDKFDSVNNENADSCCGK